MVTYIAGVRGAARAGGCLCLSLSTSVIKPISLFYPPVTPHLYYNPETESNARGHCGPAGVSQAYEIGHPCEGGRGAMRGCS